MESASRSSLLVGLLLCLSLVVGSEAQTPPVALPAQFNQWTRNVKFSPAGNEVEIYLDRLSAAGLGSKSSYLFGGFGAWIKLPPKNSAGTVTTFYMSSPQPNHCEFDFEFLGNETGKPFVLHTNIFVNGVGGREQQIFLGFDPSADYHYYSFQWNKDLLVFYVDNTPIRMFKNLEGIVPAFLYPNNKAMGIFLSIWDGSSWATQGGRVRLDWAHSPFVANYRNFSLDGCAVNEGDSNGIQNCRKSFHAAPGHHAQTLSSSQLQQMQKVRTNQVVYNYCDDRKRYPTTPPECKFNVM